MCMSSMTTCEPTRWRRSYHEESFSRFSCTFPQVFSEWNLTFLRGPYFVYILELIHTSIHTCIHVLIVCPSSNRRGVLWHRRTYLVCTSCHFARLTLDSDLSPHILYSTHSTHCVFTLVVNYINYNHTSLSSPAVAEPQEVKKSFQC